jgi:hypothetical protein
VHDARFFVEAEAAVALVAVVEKGVGFEGAEIVEMLLERVAEGGGRLLVVVVGAAERLGDDLIDDAEFFELIGVELEGGGGFGGRRQGLSKGWRHNPRGR